MTIECLYSVFESSKRHSDVSSEDLNTQWFISEGQRNYHEKVQLNNLFVVLSFHYHDAIVQTICFT